MEELSNGVAHFRVRIQPPEPALVVCKAEELLRLVHGAPLGPPNKGCDGGAYADDRPDTTRDFLNIHARVTDLGSYLPLPKTSFSPPPLDVAHREGEGGSRAFGSSPHSSISPKIHCFRRGASLDETCPIASAGCAQCQAEYSNLTPPGHDAGSRRRLPARRERSAGRRGPSSPGLARSGRCRRPRPDRAPS